MKVRWRKLLLSIPLEMPAVRESRRKGGTQCARFSQPRPIAAEYVKSVRLGGHPGILRVKILTASRQDPAHTFNSILHTEIQSSEPFFSGANSETTAVLSAAQPAASLTVPPQITVRRLAGHSLRQSPETVGEGCGAVIGIHQSAILIQGACKASLRDDQPRCA